MIQDLRFEIRSHNVGFSSTDFGLRGSALQGPNPAD
jgi:hypothetical protein